MTDDVAREIAGWLRPAAASLSENELDLRTQSIQSLASAGANADVIGLAFGIATSDGQNTVEVSLEAADATYVRGQSANLIACVSGAAVMLILRKAGASGVLAAHLVESANFLQLKERVPGLVAQARATLAATSRQIRDRGSLAYAPIKRMSTDEEATPLQIAGVVNNILKRVEATTATLDRRLRQLDEETDVLWWGRSTHSFEKDTIWESLSPIERAVQAGIEFHRLLAFDPPFEGAFSVLRDVSGDSSDTIDVVELGALAADSLLGGNGVHPLRPISSAANHAREYDGNKKVIGPMLKKAGLEPKTAVKVREIAAQVVRELQIGASA